MAVLPLDSDSTPALRPLCLALGQGPSLWCWEGPSRPAGPTSAPLEDRLRSPALFGRMVGEETPPFWRSGVCLLPCHAEMTRLYGRWVVSAQQALCCVLRTGPLL